MAKRKSVLLLFLLLGVLAARYGFYGTLNRSCVYTEEILPVPIELREAKLLLLKDAFIALGRDPSLQCLPVLGKVDADLIGPEIIANVTIGRSYFEKRGQVVTDLPVGAEEFRIENLIAVTKHGITTIDSGSGPLKYLILKDAKGRDLKIATVSLGLNSNDHFLKSVKANRELILSPLYFR